MRNIFLVKYGEIAIKGKNRYVFEDALVKCIKSKIKEFGEFNYTKEFGRILIEPLSDNTNDELVMQALTKIFGIVGICKVTEMQEKDFEDIKELVLQHAKANFGTQKLTFKIEPKRTDKNYPLDSMGISRELGAHLLQNMDNLTVDVKNPEVRIWVEVRKDVVYVYSKLIPGPGGLPKGTNGKTALLLSGGIDSPVAGWMIAKRGVEVQGVYFHSHPYTSERAKEKVIELARKISVYTGDFKLHIVPFTDIQIYIKDKCPYEKLTIIMRRIMMQIAEKIAEKEGCMSLATGESIGQVASQTMHSLFCTNSAVTIPVFRPLIGFDKEEIVAIGKKIDTYETSILPYQDCCTVFVAPFPDTKPRLKDIIHAEKKLENIEEMIQKSIDETEVVEV